MKRKSSPKVVCVAHASQVLQIDSMYTGDALLPIIETWVASKDKFRVVVTGTAMPFPIHYSRVPNDFFPKYNASILPFLPEILVRHYITFQSIGLYSMATIQALDNPIPTILINTVSKRTENWKFAAEDIRWFVRRDPSKPDKFQIERIRQKWHTMCRGPFPTILI